MTLIAHGILALDRAIKQRRFQKATEGDEVYCESAHDGDEKDIRYKKFLKADQRLKKLQRLEANLNGVAKLPLMMISDKFDYAKPTPTALENVILASPFTTIAILTALGAKGVRKLTELHEKSKAAKQEKEQAKANEVAEKAAEESEEKEIRAFENIVGESIMVAVRTADANTDESAIVNGLINETGKVINATTAGKDYITFFYNFGSKPGVVSAGTSEATVFFINPETGNYEQIAKISSKRGIQRLIGAFKTKAAELEKAKSTKQEVNALQQKMQAAQAVRK